VIHSADRALASEFAETAALVLDLCERAARCDDPELVSGYRRLALAQLAVCKVIYGPVRSRLDPTALRPGNPPVPRCVAPSSFLEAL
jgi:hypothetical protein